MFIIKNWQPRGREFPILEPNNCWLLMLSFFFLNECIKPPKQWTRSAIQPSSNQIHSISNSSIFSWKSIPSLWQVDSSVATSQAPCSPKKAGGCQVHRRRGGCHPVVSPSPSLGDFWPPFLLLQSLKTWKLWRFLFHFVPYFSINSPVFLDSMAQGRFFPTWKLSCFIPERHNRWTKNMFTVICHMFKRVVSMNFYPTTVLSGEFSNVFHIHIIFIYTDA